MGMLLKVTWQGVQILQVSLKPSHHPARGNSGLRLRESWGECGLGWVAEGRERDRSGEEALRKSGER